MSKNYKDIINYDFGDFYVREVIQDLRWELEAYYEVYIGSYLVRVVFFPDIISPRTMLNDYEFDKLINKITERYNYIKKSYGRKENI